MLRLLVDCSEVGIADSRAAVQRHQTSSHLCFWCILFVIFSVCILTFCTARCSYFVTGALQILYDDDADELYKHRRTTPETDY